MTKSIWSEPFLWIHLAGIAIAPLALQLVWMALAIGDPLPFPWLEIGFLIAVGILPIFWMQWRRPFDIFSLLFVALKPNQLTSQQQQILSLFKTKKQQLLSLLIALGMVWVLWQLYRLAPLAASAASFLPQWRIIGLLLGAIALLASNLFIQVPISVIGVLLTKEQQLSNTEPLALPQIPQQFTIFGFKVDRILPTIEQE
jgi:hypothetical protein